jgi:hypothetical protein
MAISEIEANMLALEATLAASRAAIRQNPDGPEVAVTSARQAKTRPPVITLPTTYGGVEATITVKATALTDPNHAKRLEIALDRPDIGRVTRVAVCAEPVEIRLGGVYVRQRVGRTFVDKALDFAKAFSGNKADLKVLRAQGLGFI